VILFWFGVFVDFVIVNHAPPPLVNSDAGVYYRVHDIREEQADLR
jgi:hypothetical protein